MAEWESEAKKKKKKIVACNYKLFANFDNTKTHNKLNCTRRS